MNTVPSHPIEPDGHTAASKPVAKPRVVVAGPGAPEMLHMAEALAQVGILRAYVAPFAPTRSEIETSRFQKLGLVGRLVLSQMRRRVVSDDVGRAQRPGAARVADLAATAVLRLGGSPGSVERFNEWRNRATQNRLSDLLAATDTDVFVPAGAALKPFLKARTLGVRGWLDCPTAHHHYARQLLTEELRLEPAFAPTMQYPAASAILAERLDREIEVADELIVLSSFQRRTFEEEGVDSTRLHVVPLGVDIDVFTPLPRQRTGPFTIGFVGQVTQRKGISYLVRAFEALPQRDVRLLVVGRPVGPSDAWLRPRVDHRLPVARSSLPAIYAQMNVLVLPSLIEGFGLTALEAMACGIPVIVSENTFGSDIVADGVSGYVVPIRDDVAIAERVAILMNDGALRAAMGTNARVAAEQYSWDAFGRRIVQLVTGATSGTQTSV